ncbi:MAG: ankyrin repeat domain-containing protein [Spirochaetota bacterium]
MNLFFSILYLVGLGIEFAAFLTGLNAIFDLGLGIEGEELPNDWGSAIAFAVIGLVFAVVGFSFSNEKVLAKIRANKGKATLAFLLFFTSIAAAVAGFIQITVQNDDLSRAVNRGDLQTVKQHFAKNPDDNEKIQKFFMQSIRFKQVEGVRYFLSLGADPNARMDSFGKANLPILLACYSSNAEVLQELLKHPVDWKVRENIYKGSLIHHTLMGINTPKEKAEIITVLLQKGLSINDLDQYGRTPLSRAVEDLDVGLVEFFAEKKADFTTSDEDSRTPLHYLLVYYKGTEQQKLKVAEILLKNGVDKNQKDKYGTTAKEMAQRKEYRQIEQLLQD